MRITPTRVHQRLIDKNLSDIYTRLGKIFTTQTPAAGAAGTTLKITADVVFGGAITTEGGDGTGSFARGNIAWDIAGNLRVRGDITAGSTITGAVIKTNNSSNHDITIEEGEIIFNDDYLQYTLRDSGDARGTLFLTGADLELDAGKHFRVNGANLAYGDVGAAAATHTHTMARNVFNSGVSQTANSGALPAETAFLQSNQGVFFEKIRCYDVKRTGDKYVTISWIDTATGNTVPAVVRLDVNGTNVDTNVTYGDSNTARSAAYDISGLADGTRLTIKMWMQANYNTSSFSVSQVAIVISAA